MQRRLQEQTSRELIIKPVFVLILAALLSGSALGQNARVRGLVRCQGQPAAYVLVTLTPEAAPDRRTEVYTGSDGMYYFYVPRGTFILEVWQSKNRSVGKFRLNVDKDKVYVAIIDLP